MLNLMFKRFQNIAIIAVTFFLLASFQGSQVVLAQVQAQVVEVNAVGLTVSDKDRSIKFYSDVLGFKLAGESINYRIEQERLNNVFGAKLHISGLKVESGPGIEFLEYMTPRDGRPMPLDEKVNDLIHWQTTLVVTDIESMAKKLRIAGYSFVSTGVVSLPDNSLGFKNGLLVRDPDGHAMQLIEK